MQEEIEKLKEALPAKGGYKGIIAANEKLRETDKLPMITLDQVKNFYTGRVVADATAIAIVKSTKAYLKELKDAKAAFKKLLSA